jgi:hypothetical protein
MEQISCKLLVLQLFKILVHCVEPEGLILCSQKTATSPHPQTDFNSHCPSIVFIQHKLEFYVSVNA